MNNDIQTISGLITQRIAEFTQRITALREMIKDLEELDRRRLEPDGQARPVPAPARPPAPRLPRGGVRPQSGRPRNLSYYAPVAGLAEPFSGPQAAAACQISHKLASTILARWLARGLVERTEERTGGRGNAFTYRRTPAFPVNGRAPAPGVLPVAVPPEPRVSSPAPTPDGLVQAKLLLEGELAVALKARDESNAAGRERLAAIDQRRVDELVEKIEKLEQQQKEARP